MKQTIRHIATEIIVVVIGLLIAFQIDRWSENRTERNLERKMLYEIRSSLEFDLKDLEDNSRFHKRALASHDSIIKKLQLNKYDTLMGGHIRNVFYDLLFTPNMTNYEGLKGLGLSIIMNDSIRIGLSQLYGFDYQILSKSEEQFVEGKYFERYYQMLLNNFDEFKIYETTEGVMVKSKPKDYKNLQKNSEFRILLSLTRRSHKSKLRIYEYTISKVKKLNAIIDRELGG